MEPIKPTATLTGKIGDQHEPADGDAASGTIGGLPFHLTEEILCRISLLEEVRSATVCKSWAATISERLARPSPHLLALEVPLGPTRSTCSSSQRRRGAIFSLPIDQEESPAPVMPARLPAAFSHATGIELSGALPSGDFSFVEENRVVLVNPVTGTLQSIEMYGPRRRFEVEPQLRAAAGANALFVTECLGSISLLWCEEERWFEEKLLRPEVFMGYGGFVAYADGIFYAMDYNGFTYIVDRRGPLPWGLKKLGAPSILKQYSPIPYAHLLVSEGEVIFVGLVLAPQEPGCPKSIGGFEVYTLDLKVTRWVKVERLANDRALFVSEQSSFAVHASETPGCRGNCIYFVRELDEHSDSHSTWGVYSMEEQKVLFQRPVGGSPGKYKAARWFIPVVSASRARANSGKKRKFQML
ncbi:hypothetical protein VPH35_127068 [Triticum aestivum]